MGFLDRLKTLFGGKKREEPALYAGLEKQVDALEGRLVITDHAKRIEGGVDGFDVAADEVKQMLATFTGEGGEPEALEILRKRADLARQAAHLLREPDPEKKRQMCQAFLAAFREVRDHLHFRTKTKYERIRIDFESGRLR